MNGILGLLSNSHRQIEPELMCRLMNDNRINEMIYTENNTKGLEILNTRQSVGSLSEMDQFGHDEMRRFWMYSRTIQESTISEKEPFLGEMLKPFSKNIPLSADGILDLMIAYYNDIYENLKFQKPFETNSLNSIIIPLKINKYCRCRIVSEIFGSTFSPRHQKSSYILAKFVSEDDNIDIYPEQMCNVELWDTEFYPKSQDCIIPVHHILGRFVPVKYKISDLPTMDRFKLKFKLVYPFAGIRQQLMAFYNCLNFENFLRYWLNRMNSDEILSDIYDGQIWKSFKETNDENSPNFFRNETVDSHLGLMINLDWFQPYDGTIHSTGIVKRIWVDMGVLSSNDLNNIQKKMNEFQVPADLGRIPEKIYCEEGFSNFTADQWRIFISIYATVVLWEYLKEVDRKILTYFVRICHLFVNRILETKFLDEIHKKIVDVVMLIEKKYGRNVIIPNLHLSVHLSAYSHDFGPLYAFWQCCHGTCLGQNWDSWDNEKNNNNSKFYYKNLP
ncbi:hypothetical protein Glove_256g211 [Diversispora epigaea]|uniref:Transposase domain-containing protein n=1 Tax=Diversispora epigaea TaxID=1348612 RepID=A0A397I7R4_9GLOM|nr:hypothetical protein Glove_256g211 [Diversispora epigaea]